MKKILVIEDSSYQILLINKILEKAGYESSSCIEGSEGLLLVQSFKPDAIICDLLMPKMGGKEVVKILRESGDKTPVIILTSDIQESTREDLQELGISAYLLKPVDRGELLGTIEKIFNA
jgi:CheY-like chemotaxis protein